MPPQVSLIASSVRPQLYPAIFKSLEGTSVSTEVVFAGNVSGFGEYENQWNKYIKTENIKPSQCYEIARRHATGEVVLWTADDVEYPNDVLGKAYRYWKSQNNEKLILSLQTKETGYNVPTGKMFDIGIHRFYGGCPAEPYNPLMAPIGMMSREYLDKLGGIDRRYVCGQYENDIVMRAMADGGKVEIVGDATCYIDIDHLGKSIMLGESNNEEDFLKRPFASGYSVDRGVLERSWVKFNQLNLIKILQSGRNRFEIYPTEIYDVLKKRNDQFEPYEDTDILTKSQSNTGRWE